MALTDNLVAYWKLDESSGDAADATGNGKTLTNENTMTYGSGLINNACSQGTNNTNKRLYLADSLSFTKTTSYSMAGWIKLNTEQTGLRNLFDVRENTTHHLMYVRTDDPSSVRKIIFGRASNGVGAVEATYDQTWGTTNWYHIACVFNGSTVKGYVNGSEVASANYSTLGNGNGLSNQTTLGASGNGFIYASAQFDEVGYWNRELSVSEISTLYNGGTGLQYPFTTTSIKSFNGLAKASVKSKNGLAVASIKNFNGLA